ncbi:MAG: complex I subunit 1 family protein [Desulfurococcaceae archaeon]
MFSAPAFMALALLLEWYERKLLARAQHRVGPLMAGPAGLLQPFIDVLKLMFKEENLPEGPTYIARFAVLLYLLSSLLGLLVVPVFSPSTPFGFDKDFLVIPLSFALSALSLVAAGLAFETPFTVVGTGRLIVQYAMYESLLLVSLALPFIERDTTTIEGIVRAQAEYPVLATEPLGFAVAFVALLAKLEKPPFDLPHAKQEIAAGWMTEYSGPSLAILRLGRDLEMLYGCSLIVAVFLGGGLGPLSSVPGLYFAYFLAKLAAVAFALVVAQAVAVRFREVVLAQALWERWMLLLALQALVVVLLKVARVVPT